MVDVWNSQKLVTADLQSALQSAVPWDRKQRNEVWKDVSLTTDTISSNFVYAEAETGLLLKRQSRVVPLLAWLGADEWQTYHRVLTTYK